MIVHARHENRARALMLGNAQAAIYPISVLGQLDDEEVEKETNSANQIDVIVERASTPSVVWNIPEHESAKNSTSPPAHALPFPVSSMVSSVCCGVFRPSVVSSVRLWCLSSVCGVFYLSVRGVPA